MGYQRKFLPDGSLNPKYRPDTRHGDRHTETRHGDRHTETRHGDRHVHTRKDTFIGIDGEGITLENEKAVYVLLCASTGESISNPQGLTTSQIFDFLLTLSKKYPHGIFCVFSGSYDFNLWLRNLAEKHLHTWHEKRESGKDVQVYATHAGQEYALGYRARKQFYLGKITGRRWNAKKRKYENTFEASLKVWDVFSFFQKSFVVTLRTWFADLVQGDLLIFPDGLQIDLAHMQAMKAARGSFTVEQLEEMRQYCQSECIVLVRLMERLQEYLTEAGISLSRWHGAGAIASELLKGQGVDFHSKELPIAGIAAKLTDPALYRAQLVAYHAGRFEASHFGVYTGPVYNYDIHSAFPSVMPALPSMRGGMWRRVKGLSDQPYSLIHIRWQFDARLPYFPFPFRTDQGAIYYPHKGETWVYRPELDAALRAWNAGKLSTERDAGKIEIIESYEFHPASDVKPFAFVPGLYRQRQRWKQEGRAAEKVLKLGLNSMYGKLCQARGYYEDVPSRFHQIFYAGWITSVIRARLFDAAMLNPEKVVMLAADALYSLEPLDLDIGPGLGQWELKQVDGLIVVQRGVYWGLHRLDRDPTEDEQASGKYAQIRGQWYKLNPHHQGYDAKTLSIPAILDAWKHGEPGIKATTPPRFVTLASAMALRPTNELRDAWLTWRTIERTLDLTPTGKRVCPSGELSAMERGTSKTPDARFIPTWAYASPDAPKMSQPYKLRWIDAEVDELEKLDGIEGQIVLEEILESEA